MKRFLLFFFIYLSGLSLNIISNEIREVQESDYSFIQQALRDNESLIFPEISCYFPNGLSFEERVSKTMEMVVFNRDKYNTQVCVKDDEPVGFITYSKQPHTVPEALQRIFGSQKGSLIQIVYVSHDYHRMGIGTQLLSYALQDMKDRDADYVEVQTEVDNTPARSLYEKFGFELKRFYPNGLDCLYNKSL